MDKKKLRIFFLVIILAIVGTFLTNIILKEVKYNSYLNHENGTVVRDYSKYFILEDITNQYVGYITNLDYTGIKASTMKLKSEKYYQNIANKIGKDNIKVELKNAYSLENDLYRAEFSISYGENKIEDNYLVVELNQEATKFKIINTKFNN